MLTSPENNLSASDQAPNPLTKFENYNFEFAYTSLKGQWVDTATVAYVWDDIEHWGQANVMNQSIWWTPAQYKTTIFITSLL